MEQVCDNWKRTGERLHSRDFDLLRFVFGAHVDFLIKNIWHGLGGARCEQSEKERGGVGVTECSICQKE